MLPVVAYLVFFFTSIAGLMLLHWLFFLKTERSLNLPPGPLPLPFFGSCYPFLYRDPTDVFRDLHKNYGEAVTLYAGCSSIGRMVLLMDWDIINETFNTKKYDDGVNGRPQDLGKIRGVKEGFGWATYEKYKERRAFTARMFRELGLANRKLTSHAYSEMEQLFSRLEATKGAPINPNNFLSEAVSSCILLTVLSRRLDLNDPETAKLYKGGRAFFDGNVFQMLMLPYAKFFQLFVTDTLAEGERLMEDTMARWLTHEIAQRQKTSNNFQSSEHARDLIDAYMSNEKTGALAQDHFVRMLVDIFIGAIDTASTYVGWALFYLAHMPDEQDRLYREIEKTVPGNTYPTLEMKAKLPRMGAFINEVHRFGNMTLIGLPRCSYTNDISLEVNKKRYVVPRGNSVWFTNYISQHDSRYWLDPDNFRIDRWLNDRGDTVVNHTHCFQFGVGRRACIGEPIARSLLFLFVASIIQQFRWRQVTNYPFAAYEIRMTKIPPPDHKLSFSKRQ